MHDATVVVTAWLIGAITIITILVVIAEKKGKRKTMQQLFKYFNLKALGEGLDCQVRDVFREYIIGLDFKKGKLLVAVKEEDQLRSFIIKLEDVRACTVERQFRHADDIFEERILETISLRLRFADDSPPVDLPFYRHTQHHILSAEELESKAVAWATRLVGVMRSLKRKQQNHHSK